MWTLTPKMLYNSSGQPVKDYLKILLKMEAVWKKSQEYLSRSLIRYFPLNFWSWKIELQNSSLLFILFLISILIFSDCNVIEYDMIPVKYEEFIKFVFLTYHQIYTKWKLSNSNLVQFNRLVVSNSLRPRGLQQARLPCPSPTPEACSNSCPLGQWCHPTISSSVVPFSSCPHSFPASGSFLMSRFFTSGGQSIGLSASTSVLPMNTQDWSPLGWIGWIS